MTSAGSFVAYIHPAVNTLGYEAATHAISLPSNSDRYVAQRHALPTETAAKRPLAAPPTRRSRTSRRTRQTTEDPEELDILLYTACLVIDLEQPPRTSVGLVGGRNPDLDFCFDEVVGASRHHLSFTFNKDYHFIVRDLGSKGGTTVIYGTQADVPRRNDEWIIGGHKFLEDKGPITVKVTDHLQFRVVVPPYDPTCPTLRAQVDTFRRGSAGFDDLFLDLTFTVKRSETRLQTGAQTPSHGSATLTRKLGEGTFGVVHYVCDCRSGREVARKTPKDGYNARRWKMEISLMAQVSHAHIVAVLSYSSDKSPFLDLEFLSEGSLHDHIKAEKYFTGTECVKITKQTTSGVGHLHGKEITHRDLSPKNILVKYRTKDDLFVKIGDFGLSKEGGDLQTWLGTPTYCAPEFYGTRARNGNMAKLYTPAVDIWSLGVVLGELLCGLPKRKMKHREDGLLWCQAIQERVGNHPDEAQDDMTTFLLQNMLSLEPEGRSSAHECHAKALRLSEGTHDTWKSFQSINALAVEETNDATDDDSEEPDSEQETVRGEAEGTGTVRPLMHYNNCGKAGATSNTGLISSNELLVQQLDAYLDRSGARPPSDGHSLFSRPGTQEILDRLQDPEDSLFQASQIGDDDTLSETDNSTTASLHHDGQCDEPPPKPVEMERGQPAVVEPIRSSKRTREWEAEVYRLLKEGLDASEPLGVNVDSERHMTKRSRHYASPTVIPSLESSA